MTIARRFLNQLPYCCLAALAAWQAPGAWAQSNSETVPPPEKPASQPSAAGASAVAGGASTKPVAYASLGMLNVKTAIDRARPALSAELLPKPSENKQRLLSQMAAFEAYLSGSGVENTRSWQKFLKWSELLEQLAAPKPDLKVLTDVHLRYFQNVRGFELAPFRDMRQSIGDYINAVRFGDNPEASLKALDTQLEKLVKLTYADSSVSELERMRDLGQMASFLNSARQAPELVSAMRAAYSQPNVRLQVSEKFVNRVVGRDVAQPNPVDECVLGTRVLGQSFINGRLLADLEPQSNGVSIRLTLSGEFCSDNIGHNRGVKIYTTGSSPVYASKLVTITPQGCFTGPAVADTDLQTQIHAIDHRLRFVRRIARKRAAKQAPLANAIGQERLETRLAKQFNDQIEQQLAAGGGPAGQLAVLSQERAELTRLGVPMPSWSLASSSSHILADIREANLTQLAAPGPSPLPKDPNELVAEMHQSLPINLAHSVLAGRTLHSWEMDDLLRQYTPNVPAELIKESEGKPWSITFTSHQPVEVEFRDRTVTITLRIARMANEDQELLQPATVTAKYQPAFTSGHIMFERIGEVELNFIRAASGIKSVALRSFFKGKFDKLFRQQTQPWPRLITTRLPNAPQLLISDILFDQGWAQVTVR